MSIESHSISHHTKQSEDHPQLLEIDVSTSQIDTTLYYQVWLASKAGKILHATVQTKPDGKQQALPLRQREDDKTQSDHLTLAIPAGVLEQELEVVVMLHVVDRLGSAEEFRLGTITNSDGIVFKQKAEEVNETAENLEVVGTAKLRQYGKFLIFELPHNLADANPNLIVKITGKNGNTATLVKTNKSEWIGGTQQLSGTRTLSVRNASFTVDGPSNQMIIPDDAYIAPMKLYATSSKDQTKDEDEVLPTSLQVETTKQDGPKGNITLYR